MKMKPTTIRSLSSIGTLLAVLAAAPEASAQNVSVNNATVTEGNSGVTTMTFTVSLSAAAGGTIRMRYATADVTALSTSSTVATSAGPGVTIPSSGAVGQGTPYPSTIMVAGLTGRVRSMTVTLQGLTHTFADDLDILLVGPAGQKVMLMSDAGGSNDPAGDYVFSDAAPAAMTSGAIPAGSYRPTDLQTGETLPAPAPAGPYGTLLSAFNGTDPNGAWSLYVFDDVSVFDGGALTSWKMDITTATGDYAGQQGAVEFATGDTTKTISIPIFGDTDSEATETFDLVLSNVEGGAMLSDPDGEGTITDDEPNHPARVFVSISGSDANDCSLITTPCLSLAGSLLQVTTDGEVIFLTGGEYDAAAITITKGVKVNAPTGVVAFLRQPITVNAPSGRVVLRGLTLKGVGTGNGVRVLAANSFYLENTTIDRWTKGLAVDNPVATRVFVTGSVFRFNSDGISDDDSVTGTAISVDQSRFESNAIGMDMYASSYSTRESLFFGNTTRGVWVGSGTGSFQGCEFVGNAIGLTSSLQFTLDRNLIHGNTTGVSGAARTLGTNIIRGNTTNTTVALTALAGG